LNKKITKRSTELEGWAAIARFLGQPVATAQRWRKQGLPISRSGRNVTARPAELNAWLGRDQHIVNAESDLSLELKRSLKVKRKVA